MFPQTYGAQKNLGHITVVLGFFIYCLFSKQPYEEFIYPSISINFSFSSTCLFSFGTVKDKIPFSYLG